MILFPLINAHAHNDYDQPEPLVGALRLGFCSVEADVFLERNDLLVAHNAKDLRPERNLLKMYLEPLAREVKTHGGTVYGKRSDFILLIDIKRDGTAVYEKLKDQLLPFQRILTEFRRGRVIKRAITVILSGDRPLKTLEAEQNRFAFLDGRPSDIGKAATLYPLISEDFSKLFKFNGEADFPVNDSLTLSDLVAKTHRAGQKLRFWATPESKSMWNVLMNHKVDLIGTDKQSDLADYLTTRLQR